MDWLTKPLDILSNPAGAGAAAGLRSVRSSVAEDISPIAPSERTIAIPSLIKTFINVLPSERSLVNLRERQTNTRSPASSSHDRCRRAQPGVNVSLTKVCRGEISSSHVAATADEAAGKAAFC